MDEDTLPFLHRGFDALIDVQEAGLPYFVMTPMQGSPDVNPEPWPAVPEACPAAGAGDDAQAVVPGQGAHINDAVDAVCAQHPPAVGGVEVPQVDALGYPGDDGSCEGEMCRLLWVGARVLFGMGVLLLPAPSVRFLGASTGQRDGARPGAL